MPEAEPPTSSSLSSSKSKTANPSINQIPPRSKQHPVKASLFNEHDNDWPTVDLGNLITDLDADINQTASHKMSVNNNNSAGSPSAAATAGAGGGGGGGGNASTTTLNSKPNVNNKIIPLVTSKITVPSPSSKMISSSSSTNMGGSATATITESRSIIDSGNEKGLKMKIKRNKTSISHGSSVCNSTSTSTITSSSSPLPKPGNSDSNNAVVVSTVSSGSSNNPVLKPEIKTTSASPDDASPINSHPTTNNNSNSSGNSNSSVKANNNMDGKIGSTQSTNAKLTPKPLCNSKPSSQGSSSSSSVPPPVTNNSKQTLNGDNSSIMTPISEGGTLSQASNNCSSQKSNFIKVDASVGTEIGTMTEPDCLGPLDPGTSVTLEGIVWHETEGGVLVINVTWRGKTYVGTLLDSTQHVNQWAPPRYSESPTAEIDNKKGRGNKRAGRPPGSEPELTRKNLRSSKGKPLKSAATANSPSKRKKGIKDEDSSNDSLSSTLKRQRTSSKNNSADENEDGVDSEKEISSKDIIDTPVVPNNKENNSKDTPTSTAEEEMTPKDPKEVKYIPPPPLPYALMCPSPGCKKRYRQHNGLRFHISHSHKELLDSKGDIRDTSDIERCEKEAKERLRKRGIILEEEKLQENDSCSSPSADSSKNSTPGLLSNVGQEDSVVNGSSNKEDDDLLKNSESKSSSTDLLSPMETEPVATPPVSASETSSNQGKKPLSSVRGDISQDESESQPPSNQIQSSEESNNKKDGDEDKLTSTTTPTESSASLMDKALAESSSSHNLIKSPAYSDISDDAGEDEAKKNADLKIKSKQPSTPSEPVSTATSVQTSTTTIQSPVAPTSSSSSSSNNHFPFAPYIPSTTSASASITTTTSSSFKPEVVSSKTSTDYQKMLQTYGGGFPQFPPYPPPPGGMDPNLHLHLQKFEKDKTLKEQLEREQKEKDHRRRSLVGITPPPTSISTSKTPEDLRKPPIPSPRSMISVKPEFNVPKSEPGQKTTSQTSSSSKDEGAKPTMETRGPPPASINPYGYLHPSLMRPPVGLSYEALAAAAVSGSINPLLLSPNPYMPNPYLPPHMPPSMRPPYGGAPDPLRGSYPQVPEDLSRSVSVGPPSGGSNSSVGPAPPHSSSSNSSNNPSSSSTKALDLLQQHASQYYSNSHKIHELSDRGMKSPSEKGANKEHSSVSRKRTPSPANASLSGVNRSRSPPPLRHVHTHTHTHFGLGYPLLHPPGGVPPPAAHTPFTPGAYPSHLLPPSGSKGSLPSGPLGQSFPPPPK